MGYKALLKSKAYGLSLAILNPNDFKVQRELTFLCLII